MSSALRLTGFGWWLALAASVLLVPGKAEASLPGAPANAIEAENCLPGNPPSEWDVSGAGDPTLQGFATDISVDQGETVSFKVDTTVDRLPDRHLPPRLLPGQRRAPGRDDPERAIPQDEPARLPDHDVDDGPRRLRQLVRVRVVDGARERGLRHLHREARARGRRRSARATSSSSSATTTGAPTCSSRPRTRPGRPTTATAATASTATAPEGPTASGRAYKVSYNRPFTTRETAPEDWLFNAEYPMVRWLERNGYDVSYITGVDTDRRGSEILEHKVFLSVGHDEYWSAAAARERRGGPRRRRPPRLLQRQRGLLEDALGAEHRRARAPPTARSSPTRRRTPTPRSTRSPELDRHLARPAVLAARRRRAARERAHRDDLHGQRRSRNDAIEVPAADGKMRFWRNTPNVVEPRRRPGLVGAGRHARLRVGRGPRQRLPARGARAALVDDGGDGRPRCSRTTGRPTRRARPRTTWCSTSGRAARSSSAPARVQWSWGLDGNHDRGSDDPERRTCSRRR